MEIETAIIDGADEISDPERGVFRLSEIDDLLETDCAAEFVRDVRKSFSSRVQDELARRCRMLVGNPVEPDRIPGTENLAMDDDHVPPPDESASVVPLQTPATAQPRFGYARGPACTDATGDPHSPLPNLLTVARRGTEEPVLMKKARHLERSPRGSRSWRPVSGISAKRILLMCVPELKRPPSLRNPDWLRRQSANRGRRSGRARRPHRSHF